VGEDIKYGGKARKAFKEVIISQIRFEMLELEEQKKNSLLSKPELAADELVHDIARIYCILKTKTLL
jgi:hypothetical protein